MLCIFKAQHKCYATDYSERRIFLVIKLLSLLTVTMYKAEERFNFISLISKPEETVPFATKAPVILYTS
jgi:hypothetical protein